MANIKKKPKAQSKVVDDAVKRFSDMLIKRMEEMQRDWTKPWIGGGIVNGLPQNVSGWTYTGSNAFLLFLHSSEKNYKAPVYMTPGQTHNLGAKIHKGEKAVPVFKFGISVRDKNGNKLTEDEYDNLSDSEKKECHRRPFIRVYPEFNIDQTNLAEVNKEKYDAILSRFKIEEVPQKTDGMYVNKALDRMLEKQEWVCPIQYDKESKGAYYSPGKDIVVLPTKAQFHKHMDDPEESFKDGQAFYGTALHEMAHSTGHPSRLDRLKPSVFGSPEYAKEELVAELTSAMVGNSLGFDRRISDNNVAYLQNWTAALRQEPKFLVSVMADVNKASKMLIENIDKQRVALGEKPLIQGTLDGVEEKVKNEQQLDEIKAEQEKEDPKEAVAKEWASLDEKPTVEMESGDVLPVSYNKEKDTLEVLITKEDGTQEVHSTNYDHDRDIAGNLGYVWEELSNMKQYQAKQEVKQEEQVKPEPYVDDPKVNSVIEQIAKLPEMPKYNAGELGEFSIQYNSVNNTLVGGNRGMYEGVTIDYDYDKSYQENVDALVSKLDNTDLKEYFKEENFRNQVADEMGKLDMDAKSYNTGKYPATIDYDKETDKLNLHFVTPEGELDKGMPVIMSTDYKHSLDVQSNISKFEQYLDKQNVDSVIENTVLEDYAKGVKENPGMKEFLDGQKTEGDLLNSKVYFTTLMTTLNDGQHEGHTALDIKNMSELRDYFKENPHVSEWVAQASDKELIEAGADMLPNIRYSHKEGRTLYDMEAAYSNINAKYEDVTDDRTRQIAHRIDQAKSIITAYHNNIEETKGEDYLFKEDSAHKMIPREDYAKSVSQTQTVEPTQENMDKKEMYYFSHTYLQSTDSCEELDNLVEKKDYDSLLYLTKEYDQGDALEQRNTYKNAKKFSGDDILAEDDNYAVVYNSSVGGTYDLMRKVTKEDIIDNIERYGLDSDATEDVKKVAYENVAKQFSEIKNKIPAFTMPNEDVVYFQYNQEKNQIEVGGVTNIGLSVQHRFDYDVDRTLDANLENVYEQLSELPEYQMVDEEDEEEQEELEKEPEQTNAVPHEDSNIQTDVTGLANDFAEEGKPMEQAEKEAKAVVDDKQHEAYHEDEAKKQEQTKAAQEKEAEAKAAKEKAEKEKQQQEAKKEENKPSKEVAHAAILLGALAAAKENNGVWMNKEGKSNAEFMFSHTPVTAYNNIMMNLVSDQKGYRTNVFTYYDKAQMNGVAVKQGEQATKFNWTQWDYQNLTNKDDIISSKKYESLSDDEKKMYGKHASRLAQNIYNIDQTTYPAVGGDKFIELLKEKGAQQEDMKPTTASSYLKQYDELKAKHPDVVVLLRNNDSYEIYKSDAKKASEATRLPIIKKEIDGKKIDTVSFPHTLLDRHLPNIIRAGHRIAICDQLENPKLVKSVPDGQEVIKKANAVAKAVAKQSGIEYKRVMVVQDAKYDKAENKIIVSGMSGNHVGSERIAALQKANDIYRAVVASTGTENRLDRSGRNSLLPEDDAKHEKLVQELAAGVLMARQGLPATMSKESQKLIPYWEREFKENPKMVGVIERDVNNAVETIDNLVAKREVNYQAIRGQLPPKMITDKTENYSIASDLAKLPSIDTKEIVVVKNVLEKEADVILPAGASLDPKNEVPGMRKDRITHALNKEGYDEVRFYNAGGSLGLNKPNSYFESRDVSLNQLKQYQLINHKTIDVTQQAKQENKVEIEKFQAIRDDHGRWAFYIKPKNEPQFSVYPTKEHMNTYWRVRNTPEKKATHDVLAQKWYEVAKQHPEIKVDLITPHPAKDIDMSRIVNPTITKSAQDNNVKLAFATIDGVRQRATINETQWNRMWLADDKAEYKKAVAAVVFEPILKKGVEQQQTEAVKETEKVEVKDAPEPVKKQEEHEEQNHSRGMHL